MFLVRSCCCWVWYLHQKKRWKQYDFPLWWLSIETFLIPNRSGYKQQLHVQSFLEGSSLQSFHRRGQNLAGINSHFLDTAASLFPLACDDILGQSHLCHSALKALYEGYCITILSGVYRVFNHSREIIRKFIGKKPASAMSSPTDIIGVPMAVAAVRATQ